jgi:hypothetical protein
MDQANGAATKYRGQFCFAMSRVFASSEISDRLELGAFESFVEGDRQSPILVDAVGMQHLGMPYHTTPLESSGSCHRPKAGLALKVELFPLPVDSTSTAVTPPLAPAPLPGLH